MSRFNIFTVDIYREKKYNLNVENIISLIKFQRGRYSMYSFNAADAVEKCTAWIRNWFEERLTDFQIFRLTDIQIDRL